MVIETHYPSSYTNLGNWTNPQQALNVEDNLCAVQILGDGAGSIGRYILLLKSWGCSLPANAIINSVIFNFKWAMRKVVGIYSSDYVGKGAAYSTSGPGWAVSETCGNADPGYICTDSIYEPINEFPVGPNIPTVDQLNNEKFEVYVEQEIYKAATGGYFYVDAGRMEIDYSLPAVTKLRRLLVGEGL